MKVDVFKKYQVETYVLIIFPILWIIVSGFLEKPFFSILTKDYTDLWSRGLFFGGDMLRYSFMAIYFYLYFKLFVWLGQMIRIRLFKEHLPQTTQMKLFLRSFAYLTLFIVCASLLLSYSVRQTAMLSSTPKIISISELYMKIDRALFSVDPRIWLSEQLSNTYWDFFITFIYRKLNWVFALLLVSLLILNKTLFRKYLVSFFLAPILAVPFWLAWPTVTPNEMYRLDRYKETAIAQAHQAYVTMPEGINLTKFLTAIEQYFENPKDKYPIITTNPSMHVCWGYLITYFAILLWRPLAFLFIPWFLLTCLSTLYTLQHYFIDIPAGILCALLTIMLCNYLFKLEQKYYRGNYQNLYFIDVVQQDFKKCAKLLCSLKKKAPQSLGSAHLD